MGRAGWRDDLVPPPSILTEPTGLEKEVHALMPDSEAVRDSIVSDKLPSEEGLFPHANESMEGLDDFDFDLVDRLWLCPMDVSAWFGDVDQSSTVTAEDILSFQYPGNLPADTSSLMPLNNATTLMMRFFRQRTRAGSPARGETKRSWFSDPPLFHMYDREVINVLLNIGRAHVSPTFHLFSQFEATELSSKQLCLAMASIGALFSTVDGSSTMAKSLWNDARRLELEGALRQCQPSFQSSMNSAQTFLLLDIYGLCSGDKRSYEFIEALHYQALEAFKSCWRTKPRDPDPAEREQLRLLEEALGVLDSYRVLLLLRPPCFLSLFDDDDDDDVVKDPAAKLLEKPIVSNTSLKSLMTAVGLSPAEASTRNLSIISAYAWMCGPHGQESSRTQQLWRSEFVELALERWIHHSPCGKESAAPTTSAASLSQKLLYHLAYLNLYSNLALLKRCAHEFSLLSEKHTSQRGQTSLEELRHWIRGSHFPIALWHAEAMLDLIREAISGVDRQQQQQQQQGTTAGSRFLEPIHTSYCIYFATLIVWYGTTVQERPQLSRHLAITTATRLLSRLRTPVSRVLSAALCELFRREG